MNSRKKHFLLFIFIFTVSFSPQASGMLELLKNLDKQIDVRAEEVVFFGERVCEEIKKKSKNSFNSFCNYFAHCICNYFAPGPNKNSSLQKIKKKKNFPRPAYKAYEATPFGKIILYTLSEALAESEVEKQEIRIFTKKEQKKIIELDFDNKDHYAELLCIYKKAKKRSLKEKRQEILNRFLDVQKCDPRNKLKYQINN